MQFAVYVPLTTCFTVDARQVTLVITLLSFATVPLRPSASEAMHAFVVQTAELGLPVGAVLLLPPELVCDKTLTTIPMTTTAPIPARILRTQCEPPP